MYAEAGVPEYWIVNLVDGVLEVYREPHGAAYRDTRHAGPDELVTPVAAPGGAVGVSDLFP